VESPENGVTSSEIIPAKADHFVVGFLFSEDGESLLLIEKKRPAWQVGYLNGIGGKIYPGEAPVAAMGRECIEEAGVDVEWSEFACVEYGAHFLHFFAARDGTAFLDARQQTDEPLARVRYLSVQYPQNIYELSVIPNLKWLIPLARHHLFYEKVTLAHVIMTGGGSTIARKM